MTILTVGSGQQFATLAGAVAASHDGDTIYVKAGTYTNDFAIINTDISIIGVGGMAHFVATVAPPNGKAIFVTNGDVTLDHLEFSGAAVSAKNGAGVKVQMGNVTITDSYFHDNQDGMLVSPHAGGHLTINRSEFNHNGAGDGFSHNIYVNAIDYFEVTNSYFHNAVVGHEIKSRALATTVIGNRIADGNSTASYSIDLPNGGNATIENNLIQQGPNSQNPTIIRYGEETTTEYPGSALLVQGNTIINQLTSKLPTGVKNDSPIVADIDHNHFYGLTSGQIAIGPNVQSGNDTLASLPAIPTSHPWIASPWNALISGTAGVDHLGNSSSNELFVGGSGADIFAAGVGKDSVADFSHAQGDKIDLSQFAGLSSLTAVLSHSLQTGTDTVIDLGGGNSMALMDIARSGLTASDFLFASASTAITTTNSPPTDITLSQSSIAENSLKGTIVGTFSTVDANAGETFTYSMISNSGNLFAINGANLVVAGSLDYETAPSDPISVRVTDSGGATYDQSFTIQVKDLPGVTIAGGSGDDVINSTSTVAGQPLPTNEEDNISGGDGDDSISGLDGNDTLSGAAGADSLSGGVADDKLSGGWGNDTLSGDAGNDTLVGGAGADRLIGGAGADTFVFSAAADMASGSLVDAIADFTHAQGDRIDLSNVDANTLPSGNQNFTFIGTQSFHGVAGELHYAVTASGVTVSGDVDGNGAADFSIDVAGVTILAGGDFIL
jgi:hypothetical protein